MNEVLQVGHRPNTCEGKVSVRWMKCFRWVTDQTLVSDVQKLVSNVCEVTDVSKLASICACVHRLCTRLD